MRLAVEPSDIDENSKSDGSRKIKVRPWNNYTRSIDFELDGEKVRFTFSIKQSDGTKNGENNSTYSLGELDAFIRFEFETPQDFISIEKYYIIAKKLVAILTAQNNICFDEIYISQKNSEQMYFKTGICKIFDRFENYSMRKSYKVISIFSIFDSVPNILREIANGKVDYLLELLPEDNRMANKISIKNVQDLCTALEISYHADKKYKREKDELIDELKVSA